MVTKQTAWDVRVGEGLVKTETVSAQGVNRQMTQKTVSGGHPFHTRNKGDLRDIGGDFFTTKSYVAFPKEGGSNRSIFVRNYTGSPVDNAREWLYNGPVLAANPAARAYPVSIHSPEGEMDEVGATAIARCKPTNSVADVSTFLGELIKDGLPSIPLVQTWKDKTELARSLQSSAGSEYLNVEFGWLPILRDVRKFSHAVQNADAVLRQYERDAGKAVRRQYYFPVEKTLTSGQVSNDNVKNYIPSIHSPSLLSTSSGKLYRTVETVRRQWFSGSFTYHLPSGSTNRDKMARQALEAKKLLGLSLTPEILWNIAPWSWAIDWFSNTGDVISNITDWISDGLVMHYGYVMEHTIVKHTYSMSVCTVKNRTDMPTSFTLVTETKQRRRANPFGFGLDWDGLSPRQLAIAVALGLSRSD